MQKHNLVEYGFAKKVVEDFPLIKKQLDASYKALYEYRGYMCVDHVLMAMSEAKDALERQNLYYQDIYKKKGAE